MRQLVYRVQPLPNSLLPLVWDFGTLSSEVETLYIKQMLLNTKIGLLKEVNVCVDTLAVILETTHEFMRQQTDECYFVSLRDVERFLKVLQWFYQETGPLFQLINEKAQFENENNDEFKNIDKFTRAVVLSLSVCYLMGLNKTRKDFIEKTSQLFGKPLLEVSATRFEKELFWCQEVFFDAIDLQCTTIDRKIARNQALKENIFMMVVCIDLRIPLFLVGKPGSSKSLAKTIVSGVMRGCNSAGDLFKVLSHAHMLSFQCSPLSTADGIIRTFQQCAQLQQINKSINMWQ